MNDRSSPMPAVGTGSAPSADLPDPALPRGLRLGAFEIDRVLARGAGSIVYLATDHALAVPVALQEYLPAHLVRRDAGLRQRAAEPWHEDVIARGRQAFIDEARLLARCDHPALVRVTQLFEALGSAYRVMPVYSGQRLSDVRAELPGAFEEAPLRALLDPLLGAVEAIHRSGQVHGGIGPSNVLLLAADRPLLLGAGAATREISSDLVDSLMATLESGAAAANAAASAATPPTGAARDLYMLADTLRFCITGETPAPAGTLRPRAPIAEAIARKYGPEGRQAYSAALLDTLDAALSTFVEDRPLTAAQFRDWLTRGVPGRPIRLAPVAAAKPFAPTGASTFAPTGASTFAPASASTFAAAGASASATPSAAPFAPPGTAGGANPVGASVAPTPAQPAAAAGPHPPLASWPKPPAGLTGDPITPERPPWMSPPLPPELRRVGNARARQRRRLIAAGAAGLGAVGLAAAALWWNITPEIRIGPIAARAASAPVESAAPQVTEAAASAAETVASEQDVSPVASEPIAPRPAPAAVRGSEPSQAVEPATAAPQAALAAPTRAPAPAPAARQSGLPDAAPDPVPAGSARPSRAGGDSSARPVPGGKVASSGEPRANCAGRTEFALYRCMAQQCQLKRWMAHPQCVKLRRDDGVD